MANVNQSPMMGPLVVSSPSRVRVRTNSYDTEDWVVNVKSAGTPEVRVSVSVMLASLVAPNVRVPRKDDEGLPRYQYPV